MAGESASRVKKILQQLGLGQDIIRRVAIIIYEAAMNVAIHGSHGQLEVHVDPVAIYVKTADEGAGIPDIELAMSEGFSTASDEIREMGFGAGMGLPNMMRNTDDFLIASQVGVGTLMVMKFHLQ